MCRTKDVEYRARQEEKRTTTGKIVDVQKEEMQRVGVTEEDVREESSQNKQKMIGLCSADVFSKSGL